MNYDAVNVGPADTAAGLDFLLELGEVPWVSANFYTLSGDPVFPEFIIRKIEPLSLAIIGLTPPPDEIGKKFLYRGWKEVLPQLIERAGQEAEFLILLSALPQQENDELAHRFPQIRIILSADLSRTNASPRLINNTIITQTAFQGRYLGWFRVSNAKGSTWQDEGMGSREKIKQRIQSLEYRIARLKSLPGKVQESPSTIEILSAEKSRLLNLLKQHKHHSIQEASYYDVEFIPLTTSLRQEENISSIVDSVKREIDIFHEEERKKYQQH